MRRALPALLAAVVAGCSSGPTPQSPPPPPQAPVSDRGTEETTGFTNLVSGSADSVGALPGSPDALYLYRFRQIDPSSDRFTFQDRDLSFYFRPTPGALYFQVENRKDRPVWIDWDRSIFYDPFGSPGKIAHSTTRWVDRFASQASTQIPGLQRFGDYLLPLSYLVDPAGGGEQLHRPLFPEDESALQYSERIFGVDLSFRVEDQPRVYNFRFRVASVIPR